MSKIKYLHVYIKNKTEDPEIVSVKVVNFEEIYRFILSVTTTLTSYYFLCELWNTAWLWYQNGQKNMQLLKEEICDC